LAFLSQRAASPPRAAACFPVDSGLDDQKLFERVRQAQAEFVIRASYLNRLVEAYNARLDRAERSCGSSPGLRSADSLRPQESCPFEVGRRG
jgi:hypothetical protein